MVDFNSLVTLLLTMFIYIAVGIFCGKTRMLSKVGRKNLIDIFINIILPCNIICSFQIEMSKQILMSAATIFVVALGVQLLSYLLSKVLYKKYSREKQSVLRYATICSNAGFMGNPMAEGVYGTTGLLYASIYLIPLRFFMWSAGISCFSKAKGKEVIKKLAKHPCIIAVWIGFILMLTQATLPVALQKCLSGFSACNLPISMVIIGAILSEVNIKEIVTRDTLYYCFVRLLLIPAIVYVSCKIIHVPNMITGVSVMLSGMPAGTTTAILASKYGADEKYATSCICLSTIISLVTIPVMCFLI